MSTQGYEGEDRRLLGKGTDGIYADAWGRQKVVNDFSLAHGVFTFEVPKKLWIENHNNIEQLLPINATSVNGALKLISGGTSTRLTRKRHTRYQPNRGHLYSSSVFLDNSTRTNGKLYAVIRTTINGDVVEQEEEINLTDYPEFQPGAGNIYDIQMQWRGVGNISFYANQKEVYRFGFLGKLGELSISNPALPMSFECDNNGNILFGLFTPYDGAFFKWKFNTSQETQLRCGCCDVTSEGGNAERLAFVAGIGKEITVSNNAIIAIKIPQIYNGKINTRDVKLARIKISADKKSNVEVYITRDETALTINAGSYVPINGGNIEVFAPSSAADSTFDDTKAELVDKIVCEANTNNTEDNPVPEQIDFYLTHGDYLILRGIGASVTLRAIVQLGEEI